MPIYLFNQLERDPNIKYNSFGFGVLAEIIVPPPSFIFNKNNPEIIDYNKDYIEFGLGLHENRKDHITETIFKAVEYINYKSKSKNNNPLIIERLLRLKNNKLQPYKVRYRGYNWNNTESYLFLETLSSIHSEYIGTPIIANNPYLFYTEFLDDVLYPHSFYMTSILSDILDKRIHANSLCAEQFNGSTISNMLDPIAFTCNKNTEDIFKYIDIPSIHKFDHFTLNHIRDDITFKEIYNNINTSPIFDTNMPNYINCENITYFTPHFLMDIINTLNSVSATDLDLEYILLYRKPPNCIKVNMAIDRYKHLIPLHANNANRIQKSLEISIYQIINEQNEMSDWFLNNNPVGVHIVKTFNEEGLIEFKTIGRDPEIKILIHIDFALLSMCGLGTNIS